MRNSVEQPVVVLGHDVTVKREDVPRSVEELDSAHVCVVGNLTKYLVNHL